MRKTTLLLGLAFAVTTLSGCDDDATKVCKKMTELAEKAQPEGEDAPKVSDEDKSKALEKCKTEAAKEQKENPEQFKKMSDCIMGVSDMEGAMKCTMEAKAAEGDKKEEDKE